MFRFFLFYLPLFIVFIAQPVLSATSTAVKVQINSGNPAYPFPQFYAYDSPNLHLDNLATHNAIGVTHAEMEQVIRDGYQIMMNRASKTGTKLNGIDYIKYASEPDCSEGDGYAMLGAAIMADKTTFDGLWLWIHDNALNKTASYSTGQAAPAYNYSALPGWQNSKGTNSATDGDVDMALALYTAYCQWGEFMGINDSKNNPISYKHDCIEFLKALIDTVPLAHSAQPGDTAYLSGDIGVDGYVKGGDSWSELTDWSQDMARTGLRRRVEQSGPQTEYVDYIAPAYFHEFADFFTKEGPTQYGWTIKQYQRAEASSDWLMGQMLTNPKMIPSAGHVTMGTGNTPTYTQMNEGEDFRLAWRTIINCMWHGNPESTWDPTAHQVTANTPNKFEYTMGLRFAKFLWDTRQAPWGNPCIKVPNAVYQYWGPPVLFQHYDVLGAPQGTFFLNWTPGVGSPSAVVSQDFGLMAQLYRQLEITWDATTPGDGYLTSVPHYFHDIFRLTGMLTLSGNFQAPSKIKAGANMKVYMAINKTFGFDKDSVTYTISYRNYGSLDAQNVTIVDTLHRDFEFVSATRGGVFNTASHSVTWTIGNVPGFKTATGVAPTKDSVKLVIRVVNATQKQYNNRATVSCSNGTGWTSNQYPNRIASVMERNYLDIAKRALVINQTASVPLAKAGTDVQFTINFENSSDAGWINGGRPGVHFAFSMENNTGSGPAKVMRFRLFHDADEAYIDYGNYRVSYFLYDSIRTCYQGATGCPNGWDVSNFYFHEGIKDETTIKRFQENIMPGQDSLGKWNQRFVIQFSDPTDPKRVINLAGPDCLLQQYYGNAGVNIHRGGAEPLRLAWQLHSNYNPPDPVWSDDWSWDPKAVDAESGMYYPITNDWTDLDTPNVPVTTWNAKACSQATHSVKNILVEEWDGYTWRRVAGHGPMPGREVNNVTIRDTIPAGFTFKEFTSTPPLGVAPTISGNVISWSIPKMQIKQKGTISFTATASCPVGQIQPTRIVNRSWISADKESPFSDSAVVKIICDTNYVEPQRTKSTIKLIGPNLLPISDTAKIDTTVFHIVVDDKDQDLMAVAPDTLIVWVVNPAGPDSLRVKLVETGNATGVFQTAVPISIISGASPGTGSNKIHMNPGDALWATYTDPADPTDVSQAYLSTLASFPMPIHGWIFDANGDGAADSAVVIYSKVIDSLPDSLRFNFPDQAGSQAVKTGQGAMTASGSALEISFAAPFAKNVTSFTNTTQGNAVAFLTEGGISRRIVFPLADGVGPVIITAQAVERSDPNSIDTLFVTFSEAIQAASLKGASLILIKNAVATIITIDSARALLPNRFIVVCAPGTPQPLPGDSLRINPAGPIQDLSGNKAHLMNPAVPLTLKISIPAIVTAWYVDRAINGADGLIDTAFIRFNKKVSLSDLSFLLDWGNGLTQSNINGDVLSFAGSDSVVAIALQPGFQYSHFIRTSGAMLATASFVSFPGESSVGSINDSAAPVIQYATYFPNTAENQACDTLKVVFSEPATLSAGLKHFKFFGRTGISYDYDFSFLSMDGDTARFCMNFLSDEAPRTGDSICIEANNSVGDAPGTFQNNPVNRKVALRVIPPPSDLVISVLRNPFNPNTFFDLSGITGQGTAITISRKKMASLPDLASATIQIFDALGNRVYETHFSQNSVITIGNSYYFIWNGFNTNGRSVGSGVYIAVVDAIESTGVSTKKTMRIGVKK